MFRRQGNTSVKSDNNLMAVKASGYRLKDITEHDGFVYVDYKKIKEYHEKVDITDGGDYEKESGKVIKENTIQADDLKTLRPSVEAVFIQYL